MGLGSEKHTCPHCGAVYEVTRGKQNRTPAYRTAICSHCGDVMAEWNGGARRYRRIKRPRGIDHAAKVVDGIAASRASRGKAPRSHAARARALRR
jgi:phage FluMu protein Com